jgi:hypothetical protein
MIDDEVFEVLIAQYSRGTVSMVEIIVAEKLAVIISNNLKDLFNAFSTVISTCPKTRFPK